MGEASNLVIVLGASVSSVIYATDRVTVLASKSVPLPLQLIGIPHIMPYTSPLLQHSSPVLLSSPPLSSTFHLALMRAIISPCPIG